MLLNSRFLNSRFLNLRFRGFLIRGFLYWSIKILLMVVVISTLSLVFVVFYCVYLMFSSLFLLLLLLSLLISLSMSLFISNRLLKTERPYIEDVLDHYLNMGINNLTNMVFIYIYVFCSIGYIIIILFRH